MIDPLECIELSQRERAKLSGLGFTASYTEFHQELVELAEAAYRVTCNLVRPKKPTCVQCYDQYWAGLTEAKFYCEDIAEKKVKNPELYEQCAQLLAKYVLRQDWGTVGKTHCP